MWVIYLEMAAALGIALLIVWWTWPKKKPGCADVPQREPDKKDKR